MPVRRCRTHSAGLHFHTCIFFLPPSLQNDLHVRQALFSENTPPSKEHANLTKLKNVFAYIIQKMIGRNANTRYSPGQMSASK